MSIFGLKSKKDTKKEAVKETAVKSASAKPAGKSSALTVSGSFDANTVSVIIRPHVTEKSGTMSQIGVYTFQVTKNANKSTVSQAVTSLFKVRPVKVAMINTPEKKVFVKGRRGTVSGIRKAVVTLKKGDKIDFV